MSSTVDKAEVEKFSKLASEWWDRNGKFKSLHEINPVRIEYIKSEIEKHFNSTKNLTLLDIGCGGGLISVPFKRLGFDVCGIVA